MKRLAAQSAKCTVRFNLSAAQTVSILVPVGTRVTDTSRSLVWATTRDEYVPAGETNATVVIAGAVDLNKLEASVQTLLTSTVEAALPRIIFFKS